MGLLNQGLNGLFVSGVIPYITDSLTLTNSWAAGDSTGQSDLSIVRSFSFRLTFTHILNQEGIIIESGGVGSGMVLFVFNNTLTWYGGTGNNQNRIPGDNYVVLSSPISPGTYTVEISAANSIAAMWVNKTQVDSSSASSSNLLWAGSDPGAYGAIFNSVPENPVPNDTIYPGLTGEALIYREQAVV